MRNLTFVSVFLFALPVIAAAQDLVQDGGFEKTPPVWQARAPYGARVEIGKVAMAHGGEKAAHLSNYVDDRIAAVEQKSPELAAGLYELTAWCMGKGKLRLAVRGIHTRMFTIAEGGWSQYSFVFELTEPRAVTLALEATGNATVDDVALKPAGEALRNAWQRQQQALTQFGFIPSGYSAQRPERRSAGQPTAVERKPIPITDKVIFYDPRYDSAWNAKCDLIANWFEQRGFAVKGAPELADWLRARIAKDSYGSVVVMGMGLVPKRVIEPMDETCLLRRYMDQGGRVVWTGDTALYVSQDETGPVSVPGEVGMVKILGLTCDATMWGGTSQLTEAGKRWGLKGLGTCLRGARRDEVTLSLAEDPKPGSSAVWLKTTNPDYPLSGFIASVFALHGDNTAALEEFYRMALFTGEPVNVPPASVVPTPPASSVTATLVTEATGVARRAFVRGEKVPVTIKVTASADQQGDATVRLALTSGAPSLRDYDLAVMGIAGSSKAVSAYREKTNALPKVWTQAATVTLQGGAAIVAGPFTLDTTALPVGDYQLLVEVLSKDSKAKPPICQAVRPLAVCPQPRRDGIYFGMRGPMPENPYRLYSYLDELRGLGFDLQCSAHVPAQFADACLRNGQTFVAALEGPEALVELRKGAKGQDWPNPWGGGRPGLEGLAGQACRDKAAKVFGENAKLLARFPAFSKVFITNDDFSARGGWDYSQANLKEFKAKTGLDAPTPPELLKSEPPYGMSIARPAGIIPDDDPWLLWNEFLCRDVAGGFNDATRRGVVAGCPGAIIGPVPGGAQWPLFMISSGQYPPMNFGKDFGFNCPFYYCYEGYWQPSLAYLYWSEIARMGHRDLPVWTMPDAGGDSLHYIRNVAHLLLAAGNKGIVYFIYDWTGREGRKELGELGAMLQKHGPTLGRLQPATKDVGLLVPFSEACFDTGFPLQMTWVFANLVQAHVDVEPIAEEEVETSRHRVIALSGVLHLRASSVTALADYIKRGGVVVLDRDCMISVPGAQKLDVSLGQGTDKDGLSINTYSRLARIEAARKAMSAVVPPKWDSPEETTIVRPFVAEDGTRYAYVVQVDNQEEYVFWRQNLYAPSVFGSQPPQPRERIEEFLREHGMGKNIKETTMTVQFDASVLPKGGQVVDVFRGLVLKPQSAGEGKLQVTVQTKRFGGALLAFLPTAPANVRIAAPDAVRRGSSNLLRFEVQGSNGKPAHGVFPLQVTVRDPAGNEDRSLSGFYSATTGLLQLTFAPALNGPVGRWVVDVREMQSGKVARKVIGVITSPN